MKHLIDDLSLPVYVLTCCHDKKFSGCVITWVTKASLNEKTPKIIMVMSQFNDTFKILQSSKTFILNQLSALQLKEFYNFGTLHSSQVDKFENFPHAKRAEGVILEKVAGHALGSVDDVLITPDRAIFYCSLREEKRFSPDPLIVKSALERLSDDQRESLKLKMQHDRARDEKQFTAM